MNIKQYGAYQLRLVSSLGSDQLNLAHMAMGISGEAGEVVDICKKVIAYNKPLALGDPVLFRHAKAGELCEHVQELVLLGPGGSLERAPTYRGDGFAFV